MYIFLDSGPLSTLANPAQTPEVRAITQWLADCDDAGHYLVIPEIVDYEVRRELLRSRKLSSIAELDNLKADLVYLPINTVALLKAAERPGKYIGQAGPEQVGADLVMFYDAV